jgi:hypothetical protein
MSNERNEKDEGMSRRGFIKAAVAAAAVATATGAGAAILVNPEAILPKPATTARAVTVASLPPVTYQPAAATAIQTNSPEMLARLAAAQADNVRLQAALDAAERRLFTLEANGQQSNALVETLRLELGQANNRLNVLTGLVALYDQLDKVDVASVIDGGVTAVGGVMRGFLEKAGRVAQGVVRGREALDQFEAQIPAVENGRHWLANHVSRISLYYQAVEHALRTAAEKAGSLLQMLNEWFQDVLRWLPFGVGRKAAQVMDTVSNLVAETPNTIAGLSANVVQPLDVWLAGSGDAMPLRRNLIKPLHEQSLKPAGELAAEAESVRKSYQENLVGPLQTAVYNQRVVRELIADYRREHRL